MQLVALQQLGDLGEVGGVDLFGVGGDVRRRLLEHRDDVGREQRRDRAILRISRCWRHDDPRVPSAYLAFRGVNLGQPTASGQP